MPRDIVVFDTETIPDPALHVGEEFAKPPFHQIVAISFLAAHLEPGEGGAHYAIDELRTGGDLSYSEGQLVKAFFQYLEKKRPRLVTFNGRGFDMPVLKYRGMKYNVTAPYFAIGEGRFDQYLYRFQVDYHCDLSDALNDFGATRGATLKDICGLLGVPAKLGVEGSAVKGMVESGRLAEVRDYCETDVLSTYLIFLRFALFRGELSPKGFDQSITNLRTYLSAERVARAHLGVYLDHWLALQPPSPDAL